MNYTNSLKKTTVINMFFNHSLHGKSEEKILLYIYIYSERQMHMQNTELVIWVTPI